MIVHVIDDDDAARDSVAFLLATAGFKPQNYDSAKAFLDQLASIEPGVIVSDLQMPEVGGVELLHRLNGHGVKWPVVIITGQGDAATAVDALRAGALDFIEKPFNDDELLTVVRSAVTADHGAPQGADLIKERLQTLSPAERRVSAALVDGQSNSAVAEALGINLRLVEVYRANVLTKMQAKSLSHLVRMMMLTKRAAS